MGPGAAGAMLICETDVISPAARELLLVLIQMRSNIEVGRRMFNGSGLGDSIKEESVKACQSSDLRVQV